MLVQKEVDSRSPASAEDELGKNDERQMISGRPNCGDPSRRSG
jgi:hypothetical protein